MAESEKKTYEYPDGRFKSPWIALTKAYMERAGVTGAALAAACQCSHVTIVKQLAGNLRPNLNDMDRAADALGLEGNERENYITQAYLAHSPQRVRLLVEKQTAEINRLKTELSAGRKRQG